MPKTGNNAVENLFLSRYTTQRGMRPKQKNQPVEDSGIPLFENNAAKPQKMKEEPL